MSRFNGILQNLCMGGHKHVCILRKNKNGQRRIKVPDRGNKPELSPRSLHIAYLAVRCHSVIDRMTALPNDGNI